MDIQKIMETAIYWISSYSLKIISAAIILFAGKWIVKKIIVLIRKLLEKSKVDSTLTSFLMNILYYVLFIVIIIAAATQLGVDTTSFLTIIGAAGLAVGLALKDSLSNFASGVMLILFRPFEVGDIIDTSGITAKVTRITTFNTVMNTLDNKKVIVPNSSITGSMIINITANQTRQINISLTIDFKEKVQKVIKTIEGVVKEDEKVLADPAPLIAISEFTEAGICIVARPWVNKEDYWDVYFNLNKKIKIALDNEGISFGAAA